MSVEPQTPSPPQTAQPARGSLARGVPIWAGISIAFMVIGAFGPWLKGPLGISVSGTDGSNDGWIVVAAAVIATLLLYPYIVHQGGKLLPFLATLAGIGAAAATIYDRNNVSDKLKFENVQIAQIG